MEKNIFVLWLHGVFVVGRGYISFYSWSLDIIKIATTHRKIIQVRNVSLYIYMILRILTCWRPILAPTETKTNNPMQSYTVARGEWKENAQRRQENTSRTSEMPSDKIQRVLVYGKDGTDLSGLRAVSPRKT